MSDQKEIAPIVASDETAFVTLFLHHYERIYTVVFRLLGDRVEAEDVTQQAFLKLYHSFDQLHCQSNDTNMVGWLYRVAVNQGYDVLRSRQRHTHWRERLARLWPLTEPASDPAQVVERQDTQTQVRQTLAQMKPRAAKLLLLRHAGLSYKELAEILDIAPGSVGSLLTQAKRTFALKYRQAFPDKE